MKNYEIAGRVICVGLLIVLSVYGVIYFTGKSDHESVLIQTIQDEVDLDLEQCTDGKDDCKFNTEVFNNTWLFTGEHNVDHLMNFPEEIWEEKE